MLAKDGTAVPADKAEAFFAESPDQLVDFGAQMGRITLKGGDNAPLPLGSELLWLVPAYCIRAMEHVLVNGTFDVTPPDLDFDIRFRREGSTVTIDSEHMDPFVYPALPLVEALLGVVERYIALCSALWPDVAEEFTEGFSDGIDRVRQELEDANLG